MGNLLSRRCELANAVTLPPNVLWQIENRAFNKERINTGQFLYKQDTNRSIMLDIYIEENISASTGDGRTAKLISVWSATLNKVAFQLGKQSGTSTSWWTWYMGGNYTNWSQTSVASDSRYRVIVTHEANSHDTVLYYSKNNESKISKTLTSDAYTNDVGNYIYFGSTGDGALPIGTINLARVYDKVLTTDEINAFFA